MNMLCKYCSILNSNFNIQGSYRKSLFQEELTFLVVFCIALVLTATSIIVTVMKRVRIFIPMLTKNLFHCRYFNSIYYRLFSNFHFLKTQKLKEPQYFKDWFSFSEKKSESLQTEGRHFRSTICKINDV